MVARKYDIIVCHDAAYSEIYFDGKSGELHEVDGAGEVGIEFHLEDPQHDRVENRLRSGSGR
jgi:DNA-binding transcriptional MocR family regulator